jgi:hypothetical protein
VAATHSGGLRLALTDSRAITGVTGRALSVPMAATVLELRSGRDHIWRVWLLRCTHCSVDLPQAVRQ